MKKFCFYLPQFHPIEENNQWWGKGFTEWSNVTQCTPRFKGHRQPQLPTDMGFYDLRLNEVRAAQAELARTYGIDGFIYYHYWFHGKRLLENPVDQLTGSDEPNFPFALCWANETWTRAWDGQEKEILIKQTYSSEDHISHCEHLVNLFKDKRYIRIDNKPLFMIYRPGKVENLIEFVTQLKLRAVEEGFVDVYICGVKSSFGDEFDTHQSNSVFDAVVDFQPNSDDFPRGETAYTKAAVLSKKILPDTLYQKLKTSTSGNKVISYKKLVTIKENQKYDYHKRVIPCVFPSWDNSPRRKTATIIQNDQPEIFGQWLELAKTVSSRYPEPEQFVMINAWNEWAEGCHLEPDSVMGHSFLEAVKKTFS